MAKIDPAVDKELKAIKKRLDQMDIWHKKIQEAVNEHAKIISQHAKTINELHGLSNKSVADIVNKAIKDATKAIKK